MLPLTGPDARGYREPLEWAADNVNEAGGPAGRDLELVYADLGTTSIAEATRRFAADRSIVAVIGPDTSDRFFAAAPALIAARTTVVSPTATSGDVFRAFSSSGYVWRTVQSDIAQVRTALALLARDGTHRAALVAGTDHYGTTFSDWFGFHANELGLEPAAVERYDPSQDCTPAVERALAAEPDAVLAAAKDEANAACIARAWRAGGAPGRLLFTDAARTPGLLDELGSDAEGLEGLGLGEDPDAGFTRAFQARVGHPPDEAAAGTYDAVALLAYGLQVSGGAGGAELSDAMVDVVDGRGEPTGWDAAGIAAALAALDEGGRPDINGAAGPLHFDEDTHTDLLSGTYVHWQVEGGRFRAVEQLPTGPARPGTSDARVTALDSLEAKFRAASGPAHEPPAAKEGLWALLVATSRGWDNYRHQADVFAQYQMLRAAGVPAERIIVVAEDDVARDERNPRPGSMPYEVGGTDVRAGVPIDYRLGQVDADDILAILAGHTSASLPRVIDSTAADNVYVYLAGHGDSDGIAVGLEQPVVRPGDQYTMLRGKDLADTISAMHAEGRYRRMLVAVEACEGATMGSTLDAPGALLVSGAGVTENSLSANYDAASGVWLADEFSTALLRAQAAAARSDMSLDAVLSRLYLSVSGSHVSTSGSGFGDTGAVGLGEFVTP
ncbi:MAG: ABC transporter substrate-binding protein [Actinomycetota bacterium]|nr:ABC transporter substrate-binding protein [Actinomycetota bacterium]